MQNLSLRRIGGALIALPLLAATWIPAEATPPVPPASTRPVTRTIVPAVPPASAGHALVFHDSLGAVLLINAGLGSMSQPPSSARTVLWRWTAQKWEVVDSAGPPIRNLAGVAYDSKRNVLVMYGGSYDQNLVYDETWEWRAGAGWSKKPGGIGKRDHTQMAYDPERQTIVLFGGQIDTSSFPADTWTWDGNEWRLAASTGPGGRVHHSLVYDPFEKRLLLFGGHNPATGNLGDTWSWTGTSWASAAPAIFPRSHARLGVFADGVMLLGGLPPGRAVLSLENGAWRADNHPNAPSARYLTAIAYDPRRKVTVLFGGGDPASNDLFGDTWEFDARSGWRRIL